MATSGKIRKLPLCIFNILFSLSKKSKKKAHNLKAAAKDITALVPILGITAWQFSKYDALAGKLMIPYFLFTCFAAALTVNILERNGEKVD